MLQLFRYKSPALSGWAWECPWMHCCAAAINSLALAVKASDWTVSVCWNCCWSKTTGKMANSLFFSCFLRISSSFRAVLHNAVKMHNSTWTVVSIHADFLPLFSVKNNVELQAYFYRYAEHPLSLIALTVVENLLVSYMQLGRIWMPDDPKVSLKILAKVLKLQRISRLRILISFENNLQEQNSSLLKF